MYEGHPRQLVSELSDGQKASDEGVWPKETSRSTILRARVSHQDSCEKDLINRRKFEQPIEDGIPKRVASIAGLVERENDRIVCRGALSVELEREYLCEG